MTWIVQDMNRIQAGTELCQAQRVLDWSCARLNFFISKNVKVKKNILVVKFFLPFILLWVGCRAKMVVGIKAISVQSIQIGFDWDWACQKLYIFEWIQETFDLKIWSFPTKLSLPSMRLVSYIKKKLYNWNISFASFFQNGLDRTCLNRLILSKSGGIYVFVYVFPYSANR